MKTKVDNHNLWAKLAIRRWALDRYHASGPIDVFDACQGSGRIWGTLRKEYTVSSYWGVDVKPLPGRLKIDSSRLLGVPGFSANVVDIDTYGSPWKHWLALLPNITIPTTVFLTVGRLVRGTPGKIGKAGLSALGIAGMTLPAGIEAKLGEYSTDYCMSIAYNYGMISVEVSEVGSGNQNMRYLAVRVIPRKE